MGDAVVCADEQENAVSENTPEDGSVEADPAEDQTAADEQEVSENDAVSDNNAVSENDTDDADVEEDENEAENAGDVSTEEEDAADGEIVWKEPAADWYKSFEYETKDSDHAQLNRKRTKGIYLQTNSTGSLVQCVAGFCHSTQNYI